jgi:phosphopantetheine adenylyltransferase
MRMIASSLVKQVARMGGSIGAFVPEPAARRMLEVLKADKP